MRLTDLSDDELLSILKSLNGKEQQLLAHVVAYLAEVDERRLHLRAACSSLFDFCVRRLGMSEGEAFRRITAARLVRRFPDLLARIEKGEIHLSALVLLRDHLTPENHDQLVSAAAGQSKRKVQELVASRFPKPDVPSTIRQLPAAPVPGSATSMPSMPCLVKAPADAPVMRSLFESPAEVAPPVAATRPVTAEPPSLLPTGSAQRSMEGASANTATLNATQTAAPGAMPAATRIAMPAAAPGAMPAVMPTATPAVMPIAMAAGTPRAMPITTPKSIAASKPATIEPLSEARHKVQLTVTTEVREKLERAMALLRHRNPSGDLAVVVERAVDLLLANLEKEILGKRTRPQPRLTASKVKVPELGGSLQGDVAAPPTAVAARPAAPTTVRDARVSRPVRRAVFERDGERCSFVDAEGSRCPSTSFLEIDHRRPRALGGDNKADNLRVVCRHHNQWLAEQAFGREHVAHQVHLRRNKSTPRSALSPRCGGQRDQLSREGATPIESSRSPV